MASNSNSTDITSGNSSRVPVTLRNFFFQDPFFQNSWDEFERIRQDMMKESQEFWSKVGQDSMSMLKNEASTLRGDSKMDLENSVTPMIFPRRWMFPR